jgi:hypothetical protein
MSKINVLYADLPAAAGLTDDHDSSGSRNAHMALAPAFLNPDYIFRDF